MKRVNGLMVTLLAGTLMLAAPAFAQSRGGHGGGGYSHGGGERQLGSHSYNAPARGFSGAPRSFESRGFDHGPARGGVWAPGVSVYPGYVYPYSYNYVDPYYYAPSYVAPQYYAAPVPAPACNPNGGYYDGYGNWVPDPNCQVPPVAAPAPYGH